MIDLTGVVVLLAFWRFLHQSFTINHDMLFESPPESTEHEKQNGDVRPDLSAELEM